MIIVIPTRNRPEKFKQAVKSYIDLADEDHTYIAVVDSDDVKTPIIDNLLYVRGNRKGKIDAMNRTIPKSGWDICVMCQDDLFAVQKGWDTTIKKDFKKYFPDFDGALWYTTGKEKPICLQVIIGFEYYQRFGYIYHPSYKSEWPDNEFTDVGLMLGRLIKIDKILFEHRHPGHGYAVKHDELYIENQSHFWEDKANYEQRKEEGFW
jgi:hypothetical protein